ncbi:MAG: exopolyphosphatase, partial [Clostridia bacterium]|nr:exopolyphosphatase [Clostridia bacterium]
IGADPHYVYSYNIINASQIIGLSDDQLRIVSSVARYHSLETPSFESAGINKLNTRDRITAMKLIAIIRVADALDTSHKQKLKLLGMNVKEGQFVIRSEVSEEAILENWTFQMKSEFFTEVFGVEPMLSVKNRLIGG